MMLKKLSIIVVILLLSGLKQDNFPLEVSEIQSPNTIVRYKGQKLILVDFWATWCGPCRIAGRQLEFLQEQLKNKLFIISITDETHEVVEKFLKKHPMQLMVVRDIAGNIFSKYQVRSRPYSILFTAEGDILWRGHPSGLTYEKIKKFHRKNSRVRGLKNVEDFLLIEEIEKESEQEDDTDLELFVEQIEEPNSMMVKKRHTIDYYGSIRDLVADINRVPKHYVKGDQYEDFYIHIKSPLEVWNNTPDSILQSVEQNFGINVYSTTSVENVTYLVLDEEGKLWDTKQIDWDADVIHRYLVGEDRVEADNLSVADFCLLLSNVKGKTYKYSGEDKELHDWDIHFRFNNLMEAEFYDEYGIRLEKKQEEVRYFHIE